MRQELLALNTKIVEANANAAHAAKYGDHGEAFYWMCEVERLENQLKAIQPNISVVVPEFRAPLAA